MHGNRPTEAMKALIRRLGNGETIRFLGMDNRRVTGLCRRYCFVPSMATANTNLVDGSIARGYLERNGDGEYALSPSGRAIYGKMDGDFDRWEIVISCSAVDGTVTGGVSWRCTCVPVGKDGAVVGKARATKYWEARRYSTLDDLVSTVTRNLKAAGFTANQIAFSELTPEVADIDRRQRMLMEERRNARHLERLEHGERRKREAGMTIDHVLMTPVSALDISTRSANCLREAGVSVIGELVVLNDADIMAMKNAGRKTLYDLKEALFMFDAGLRLGDGLPDWQIEEIARLKDEVLTGHKPR